MLVIVEGADGSGKTTVINELTKHPMEYFKLIPFFSSGTFSAEMKEKIINAQANGNMLEKNTLLIKALTYMMATALDFINDGFPVVLDRFIPSYFVYQIKNSIQNDPNLPSKLIESFEKLQTKLNLLAYETRVIYIYLHIDPTISFYRLHNRSEKVNALDDYYLTHQAKILTAYEEYFKSLPIKQKYKISTDVPIEFVMNQPKQILL